MDPTEMTPVLRELQARDAYAGHEGSGRAMSLRPIYEKLKVKVVCFAFSLIRLQ